MKNIKMLSGGHTLASGDSFMIIQTAGTAPTFSYTATADLVITSYSAEGFPYYLGTWVNATSGVYGYLHSSSNAQQNVTGLNKLILKSGQTLTINNSGVNVYGTYLGGFEL